MPSDLEKLVLNALDLNDQVSYSLEDLVFTPAELKARWADNPNADGPTLVEEPHYGPAYFDALIRVVPKATTDLALEAVGLLMNRVQDCPRFEDGQPMEWTPNNGTRTYTAYAMLAEVAELPITLDGELAGWFIRSPLVRVKFTLRPFLYAESKVFLAATESAAAPIQDLYVKCGGDVPAEAEAIITDKATQSRRFLKWGRGVVASKEGQPPVLITAASLVTTNFTGTAATRSGAYSEEKVKRGVVVPQATVLCGTGDIQHVGPVRVFGRVYTASSTVRYRIAWRSGDGPWERSRWFAPQVLEQFCDIDFGEAIFSEAETGEQRGEIRLEVKTTSDVAEADINYFELIPSESFARARGLAVNTPTKLIAYDTFLQTEGNLDAPKTLPLGGNWSEASKVGANGFQVIAAEDIARRTTVSDANVYSGSFAIAGTSEPTTSKSVIKLLSDGLLPPGGAQSLRGTFLRYLNTTNWLGAFILINTGEGSLYVIKSVAGVQTVLDSVSLGPTPLLSTNWYVSLLTGSDGTWQGKAWWSTVDEPAEMLYGQDAVLATGGTLAKGKGGFYDAWNSAVAFTRKFDDFSMYEGEPAGVVCYSGRKARITDQGFTREDSAGKYQGEASIYRGSGLYLHPEGPTGEYNRIALAMRRTDADTEADTAVTDKHTTEILGRERFLLPR